MSIKELYTKSRDARNDAVRAYRLQRITLHDAEIKRETDAEIRAALAQVGIAARRNHSGEVR